MVAANRRTGQSGIVRDLWRDHEEGILYIAAVLVYIPAGYFLRVIVLNWIVGILFPVFFVCVLPAAVRQFRRRGGPS